MNHLRSYNHLNYSKLPNHIGLIPDGGRRYAKKNKLTTYDSYLISMKKIFDFINTCFELGVNEISIYFSSLENYKRTTNEINDFESAETFFLQFYMPKIREKYINININLLGNKAYICKSFIDQIDNLILFNKKEAMKKINICMAYCPLYELNEFINKQSEIDLSYSKLIEYYEITPVDLIIRTGGALTLSNFMLLHSGYSRLKFFDNLFNELTTEQFKEALMSFGGETRKYGE